LRKEAKQKKEIIQVQIVATEEAETGTVLLIVIEATVPSGDSAP
jgi:hypothetical protein